MREGEKTKLRPDRRPGAGRLRQFEFGTSLRPKDALRSVPRPRERVGARSVDPTNGRFGRTFAVPGLFWKAGVLLDPAVRAVS